MATINKIVIPLSKDYDDSAQSECKKQIVEKANDIYDSNVSIFDKRTLEETPEITVEAKVYIDSNGHVHYHVYINTNELPNYIKRDMVNYFFVLYNKSDESSLAYRTFSDAKFKCSLFNKSALHNVLYNVTCFMQHSTEKIRVFEINQNNTSVDITKCDLAVLYSDCEKTNPFLRVNIIYPPKPTAETE